MAGYCLLLCCVLSWTLGVFDLGKRRLRWIKDKSCAGGGESCHHPFVKHHGRFFFLVNTDRTPSKSTG